MIQLSYVSRSAEPMAPAELLELLYQCRTNNRKRGITGLLLYANGTFLQALEGEDEVIDELIGMISNDPRHAEVQIIQRKEVPERQYSEWSMGFDEISDESLADIDGLRDFGAVDFNFQTLAGNEAVVDSLLQYYREPHWDQVLSELDAKDKLIHHLAGSLATMRDRAALARLALESITEASRNGQPQESLIELCESALEALKRR